MRKKYTLTKAWALLICMFVFNAQAQLSGLYTINSAVVTGGTNYQTFNDFANDINTNGVSGAVTVDVVLGSGPYNEQVLFNQITGASSSNNITINGNGNLITFNSTNINQRYTMGFNGADYFTVNELNMQGTGTYAYVCLLYSGANNNLFSACSMSCTANNNSTNQNAVVISGSGTGLSASLSGNNNTFIDCDVFSGYYGMAFYGPTGVGTYMTGNKIINCHVRDFYVYGIYMYYQENLVVSRNLVERPTRTNHTTFYGIYCTQTSGSLIEQNTIQKPYELNQTQTGTSYLMYILGNSNSTYNGAPNIVRNNIIQDIRSHTTIYAYYMAYINGDFIHNTVSIEHPNANATSLCRGLMMTTTGTKHVNAENNLVYINRGGSGQKHGIYYSTLNVITSNNNNVWVGPSGTNNFVGYAGGNQSTLANLQTASGNEANSYNIDPVFVNAISDVEPTATALNNLADPLGVVFDNRGAVRNQSTPDIGAIEFLTPSCSGAPGINSVTSPTYAICPGENVTMGLANLIPDAGITYQWESSTLSNVGPFIPIPGETGLFLTAPSVTANTWFNVVMTCTAPGGGTTSYVGTVQIAGPTSSTVPYIENFEGIGIDGRLPNCSWTASNMGDVNQTYVTAGTGNRVPNSGVGFATFANNSPGTSYYYTNPIQMNAGITYSAAVHYATEYFGYTNWTELSILVGPNQNPTGMVQVATVSPALSGPYKLLDNLFTVPSSGQYYVAIRATSTAGSAQYLSWDDLSITIPCEPGSPNTPTLVTSNSGTVVCEGTQIGVNVSGADTYSWSEGSTGQSVGFFPTLANNTLSVYGTNLLTGCTATATEIFLVHPSPIVFITATEPVVCAGDPTNLTAYGADQFAWNHGPTNSIISISPMVSTSFTVVGINSFGCSAEASYSITVNPLPLITVLSSHPLSACIDDVFTLNAGGANSYVWFSNVLSEIYQGPTINVSSPATVVFTVSGTDANGCTGSATIVQGIEQCTGIIENTTLTGMTVFPNPTKDLLNINFNIDDYTQIELTDVLGRIILVQNNEDRNAQLDLTSLAKGIYYMRVKTGAVTEVVKVVKE